MMRILISYKYCASSWLKRSTIKSRRQSKVSLLPKGHPHQIIKVSMKEID